MPWTKDGFFPAIFTTQNDDLHKRLKSPIANLYSLSNVITLEKAVDGAMAVLFGELDRRFVASSRVFDLCDWLQYFAFEAMGTMTFSSRYGFMESGGDVDGMIDAIWQFMLIVGPMTQVPWMDKLLFKNDLMLWLRPDHGSPILKVTHQKIADRLKDTTNGGTDKRSPKSEPDLLDRFLEIKAQHPEAPAFAVPAWTFSNVIAGSDSTAVAMKTAMYHLLASPGSLQKLYAELSEAERQNRMSRPHPRWEEVQSLPYLDACVQEALRLHPPFCLPLERVVPDGGMTIKGRFLPPGTCVGVHPYVVNRHGPTFGADADMWRPERWLGLSEDHRRRLENAIMTFGAGRRVCLGKHIALLEVKKIIPALLLNYEVSDNT
ncbi:Pisatin demethylase [Cytospora mali]|uniref:Pisatin demethylase n=1 Tax=Cytospora mali TaxID=578113 RepID=A0A194W4A3_CYTMA|nr:Pisatin demethylase [Valsa mali]